MTEEEFKKLDEDIKLSAEGKPVKFLTRRLKKAYKFFRRMRHDFKNEKSFDESILEYRDFDIGEF